MKQSIERSLKFLCYLIIMFCIVYACMLAIGMANVKPEQLGELLSGRRGQLMILAIVGLAALYPFYGVVKKRITRVGTSEIVINMERCGFRLKSKDDKKMVFVFVRLIDRLKLRFDDRIDIDNSGEYTLIKGSRRAVYTVLYKLGGDVL